MKSFKEFIKEDAKGLKSPSGGLTQKGRDYFNRKDGTFFSFGGNSTWLWYNRDSDGEALNNATVTFI